jgi:predicted nucleotidyltransferase
MRDEVTILRAPARATLAELTRLAAGPLARAGAERAVVFGSFARGDADGYSDLDLVVVLATDLPFVERGRLLGELVAALPLHVEILVYTPEEYARGMERGFGVFDALRREGVTIHERRAA